MKCTVSDKRGMRVWMAMFLIAAIGLFLGCRSNPQARGQGNTAENVPAPAKTWSQVVREEVTQGALRVKTAGGVVECPLKHTDVQAEISGFIARATVTQTFYNPYNTTIEATYVFPLPHTAAVDQMTMVIGKRRIVGVMKRREEAKRIYQQAIMQGKTASLLEEERPNIFTQTVGNIRPKQEVRIEISYVDTLKYDMGVYEFHFPMVVGPRYIPGAPTSAVPAPTANLPGTTHTVPGPTTGADPSGAGWSPDTDRVDDASRITPPVLKSGFRTGHDISLSVNLDAGVRIHHINIVNHQAKVTRIGEGEASVLLDPADAIPNKDFVMRYEVVGEKPELALLSHAKDSGGGYFMLMMQPKLDESLVKSPPREIVFLIDVSGSMSGEPTEKNKQIMRCFIERSKPEDTMQVITFAGSADKLFPAPVPATEENTKKALDFTNGIQGGGGTEMLKGVEMALSASLDPLRNRVIILLTDGFIGNEAEIIKAVGEHASKRNQFWAIGIGSSPNRFLIDGVAKQGGGMSAVVELKTDPAEMVGGIVDRIHHAQLADVAIDWHGLKVSDIYPKELPDLWAGRPLILYGRYTEGGTARVTVAGKTAGKPVEYAIDVSLPELEPNHDVLAKVWARNKIEDLSAQMLNGDQEALKEQITNVALQYTLMSKYTSFVAVDEHDVPNPAEVKPPTKVTVPVEMPDGVSHEGVFGEATATTNTAYIGGGGGDPWIRVQAPADARQVVAIFPNGEVKELAYNKNIRRWSCRFDFPFGTAAGAYRVTVVVVHQDGARSRFTLTYANLLTSAASGQSASLRAKPGQSLPVTVTGAGIQRAIALTPWGERETLESTENGWQSRVTVPTTWPAGDSHVTLVLFDGAHNRTEISVDLTVE